MATRYGWPVALTLIAASLLSLPTRTGAARQRAAQDRPEQQRDFDIRDTRIAAAPRLATSRAAGLGARRSRVNRENGTLRTLDAPAIAALPRQASLALTPALLAEQLGLKPSDLAGLEKVRDFTSRSTGIRHLVFRQVVDGHPVFDSAIAIHLHADGRILRVTSNASPIEARTPVPSLTAASGTAEAERQAPGTASPPTLAWLPLDGGLRLAWHTVVRDADTDARDVLIDAHTGELLVRRNRSRDGLAMGRVLQSSSTAPAQPDPMPGGASGAGCPPPANYQLRSLAAPFRDPATVVAATGRLEGNNSRVFRGNGGQAATGSQGEDGWLFDFPFNTAGSAETFLFFAANFAHDFFYALGFDEAAGNFQQDNFGRGGAAADPIRLNARASGRNNATYVHAPDGSSPTINMFLWDGTGCWASDVDGDGTLDLDADYDLDILVHEFHHGVSLRLNTAFTGNEAGAIGEGGGDFFAYSVNANPVLAEYARPGGLRSVNGKGYGDWSCLLGLFCEVHDNGEIWANVLWDIRERFRTDHVGGSSATAVHEAHQLYVDALTFSPPAPTMLDLRDAMLLADSVRNAGNPVSRNSCRLWESFAARGMGQAALDTADNGLNRVTAAFDVPEGCVAPPGPPVVTIVAATSTALEASLVPGSVTIRRSAASPAALTVSILTGGSATAGSDYAAVPAGITIPGGAAEVTVPIVPIDDSTVEGNETIMVMLRAGGGYSVGAPSSATVTLVSDDVAPDLTVTAFTVPARAAPGSTIAVTDTTRNQGGGHAARSETRFYLSKDALLDAADQALEGRTIDELAAGTSSAVTTSMVLPAPLAAGTYFMFAKADAGNELTEVSEFNNARAASIAIGPDLLITTLTAPATAAPGASISVADTTANQGAAPAAASTTRFFLSANLTLEPGDIALQSRAVPGLAVGAASSSTSALTVPAALPAGTYYLIAQADADATVGELAENNNTRSAPVRIGPDLAFVTVSAPTQAPAGATIAVSTLVRNTGTAAAGASVIRFHLSANASLDPTDVVLEATQAVPALAPGASASALTQVVLPEGVTGNFFLLIVADATQAVVEANETNNVAARVLQLIGR